MTRTAEVPGSARRPAVDPYLESVMRILWPAPTDIRLTGRRGARGTGRRFVAIPSAQRPKLLVPSRPRRVTAGAVQQFKTATTRREQVQLRLLSLGARIGAHELLPDHVVVGGANSVESPDIESHLHAVLGAPVRVSLYIGPARAVRKPVLQVIDDAGRTFAFAKIGVDPFTERLVEAEAEAVEVVRAARPQVVQLPELLHRGAWHGHSLLVQSAFPRGTTPSAADPVLARAVREIAETRAPTVDNLAGSTYWARLLGRVQTLERGVHADRLRAAVDETAATHAATPLSYGCWHGDFTPWNMTATTDHLQVWDWEKFEADVPVGFDLVHFAVQGDVVDAGMTPEAAFARIAQRAVALLDPVGNGAAALLVVRLYAIDIATRYLQDRELDAGQTRMTELANWLQPVLDGASRNG